ncbi:unnamed protein product, partial [Polarella glacialis]
MAGHKLSATPQDKVPDFYITAGNLKVHPVLYKTVEETVCPGTGFSSAYFWNCLEHLTLELRPEIERCLARRDELQEKIDAWYAQLKQSGTDLALPEHRPACRQLLKDIGYLVPDRGPVSVTSQFIDPEIALIPAPQLVVPSDNARYVLNAINARWGSLFDALYGFDVIPETKMQENSGGGAGFDLSGKPKEPAPPTGGYNPLRGEAVIEFANGLLDELNLLMKSGMITSLRTPSLFVGSCGNLGPPTAENIARASSPCVKDIGRIFLKHNGLHLILEIDRDDPIGSSSLSGIKDITVESALSAILDMEDLGPVEYDGQGGQSYGGGLPLSEFNKLVPPGWRPGIPGYPIKLFFERLKLWYRVTDNAEAQLGILVAGRLQGAPQKIALRLRLPRPVAAGGGYDIGDEALIRLSQEQVIDPANNTIVQEYIPSGLQFLCQALRAIYGLQDQDRTTVALDSFYEFKRGHLGLAEFAQEFDHRYESAEDEAGLQMNDTGKTYFFLRGSGLGDKIIEDIKLQMRGDMSRYQEIRTLVLKLARANDKDKETLNMYQDQTDFNYKLNLDETNGNYYGSWHDPTTGEIIEYDYGANTSDDMYYGDYDCVYDGEYSDYDGAGYDDDWYGDDGWQDEVYHGDFPLEEWTWPASAPDSSTVSTAETTLLDVDPSYWKGQTKGKGKGFGAKGKGPSGGSASGIGCATCGSRWRSSLDCPLNDPSKGDQGKGKGGKDYHYENFWKGKGKGKKGGKSKGFGKGWSKGFGKYRPSFGSGKGYGKYSGGYGKSYGKSYGKGKFKGGYGGFRYSSPYNFTAFQDHEVQEALEHAPTIAFKADGSGTQYYDFEDEKPSSSTRPPPQSTTEPMIDTAGNLGYNDGYGELDTAPAPMPDVRVNSLSFLVGTCSSAFPTDHEDWSSLYHSVRGVKRHGLLIDPGAASGLIGSDTLKEFRDEILLPLGVDIICRPTTQNVSGISGKPEPALSRVTMPIFPGIKSSTFTADVIGKQGSKCPALLPNPSMRAANMGLLTNFFENGDGMLIVHDNGKRLLYRCLLTESGHYILPTDNVKNNNNVDEKATRKASAFYAAVLQDATQQWSDINAVYLAVDKAAVADPVADRAPPSTRSLRDAKGEASSIPGRAIALVRNVGHHMFTDMVYTQDGKQVPEGFVASLSLLEEALPMQLLLRAEGRLFGRVEEFFGLRNTIKMGIMDEERRTSANLRECLREAAERVFFINTGPVAKKSDMKFLTAYEDLNVDVGLFSGFQGKGQIGKGMWAKPDSMKAMLEAKISEPMAGASTAWVNASIVPSPAAAALHSIHYHRVDVLAPVPSRQMQISTRPPARIETLLEPPFLKSMPSKEEIIHEVKENAQSILGYVVRWVDLGVGCSKVPDLSNVGLMEDRATLRISSQLMANWLHHGLITNTNNNNRLHHGLITKEELEATFKEMAKVVDQQNVRDKAYTPMSQDPSSNIAFQ